MLRLEYSVISKFDCNKYKCFANNMWYLLKQKISSSQLSNRFFKHDQDINRQNLNFLEPKEGESYLPNLISENFSFSNSIFTIFQIINNWQHREKTQGGAYFH